MASRGPNQKRPRRVEGPLRPRLRGNALLQSEALTGAKETQCDMSPKVVTANTGVAEKGSRDDGVLCGDVLVSGTSPCGAGAFARPAEQSEAQPQHSPPAKRHLPTFANDLENRFGKLQVVILAANPEIILLSRYNFSRAFFVRSSCRTAKLSCALRTHVS